MFAGKKSAQIREILISESAWEEMTCLFAPSLSLHLQNTPHRSVRQNDLPEKFTKTTRVRFTVDVAITPKIGAKYIKIGNNDIKYQYLAGNMNQYSTK